MKKILPSALFLAFLFLLSGNTFSQKLSGDQQKKVDALFAKKKVLHFKFKVNSLQEVTALSKIISIDGNKGTLVSAHATKPQFSQFITKNYAYTVAPAPAVKAGKKVTKKK